MSTPSNSTPEPLAARCAAALRDLVGQTIRAETDHDYYPEFGAPRWWRVHPEHEGAPIQAITADSSGVRCEITLEEHGLKLSVYESEPYSGPDVFFLITADGVARVVLYSTDYDPAYQNGATEDAASLVAIAARFLLLQVKPTDALTPAVQQPELEFATAAASDDQFRTYVHQLIPCPSPEDPDAQGWAAGFHGYDGAFVWFGLYFKESDAAAAAREMTARRVRKGPLG